MSEASAVQVSTYVEHTMCYNTQTCTMETSIISIEQKFHLDLFESGLSLVPCLRGERGAGVTVPMTSDIVTILISYTHGTDLLQG